jgi:hypothetical protein
VQEGGIYLCDPCVMRECHSESGTVAEIANPGAAQAFAALCTDHRGMLDADALVKILSRKGAEQDSRCSHLRSHADAAGLIDFPTLLAAVSEGGRSDDEDEEGDDEDEKGAAADSDSAQVERRSTRRQRIYDESDEEDGRSSILAWRQSQDANSRGPSRPEAEGPLKVTVQASSKPHGGGQLEVSTP